MQIVYSGQMNALVEFFEITTVKNDSGEPQETRVSLGKRHVQRLDSSGGQEVDGAVIGLAICTYQMRYENALAAKISTLEIDDFDGTYEVVGPMQLLEGGRRYMRIKCRKRGEY